MVKANPLPSTATLELVEIQEADIPSILRIYVAAFSYLPTDRVIFPNGPSPEALAFFGENEMKQVKEGQTAGSRSFVVKDKATGDVLTVAKWKYVGGQEAVVEKPPVLGTDAEQQGKKDNGFARRCPPGGNMEGKMAYLEHHAEIKARLLGERKYWRKYLQSLLRTLDLMVFEDRLDYVRHPSRASAKGSRCTSNAVGYRSGRP